MTKGFDGRTTGLLAIAALLFSGGCAGSHLKAFDKVAVGPVLPAEAGLLEPGFGRIYQRAVARAMRGRTRLRLVTKPGGLDSATLVVEGYAWRDCDSVAVTWRFKTREGRVLSEARQVFPAPPLTAARCAPWFADLLAWLAPSGSPPSRNPGWLRALGLDGTGDRAPPVEGPYRVVDAPGRLLARLHGQAQGMGPGKAGLGHGAPDYRELFHRGRRGSLSLSLALNGYGELFLEGGMEAMEGKTYEGGGLVLRLGDFTAVDLAAGLRLRYPLWAADCPSLLWRFRPPFGDTRGVWLTASVAGGLSWNRAVTAAVQEGAPLLHPALPTGTEFDFYRDGTAFFAEILIGLELRIRPAGGGLILLALEGGLRAAQAPESGAGRATEGTERWTVPLRATCGFAF